MGSAGPGRLLAAVAVVALVCGGAAYSARQATTHPVLQQTPADCQKIGAAPGVVVLGLGCADERGLVHADTWNVGASSAHWAEDTFASAYEWDLPDTVPASGAPLTLKIAAAEITRQPGAKACAHIEATGGFTFRSGSVTVPQPAKLEVCANSGASAAQNLTVTLVPPASAGTVPLRIALQNGPTMTFRYGTQEGRFSFGASRPGLKAGGDSTAVKVVASPKGRHVTAEYEVVTDHVRRAGRAKVLTGTLELLSILPQAQARGCAPGTTASLKLTDDGRRDSVRLTTTGKCAFVGGTISNGVAGSANVTVSP